MAHEDVVPVNPGTLSQWTHPPFEGVVDDEWVWGRGAADCKNQVSIVSGSSQSSSRRLTRLLSLFDFVSLIASRQLMGIMSALDKLIEEGFQPERTILISFGFDEEIGGKRVSTRSFSVVASLPSDRTEGPVVPGRQLPLASDPRQVRKRLHRLSR
jgi:Gly-Xaa carboxypeptidase